MKSSEIIVILNGWSFEGITGGDRHLLDMISNWSEIGGLPVQAILPELANKVISDYLSAIQPHFLRSSFDKRSSSHTLALVITYALRIIASSFVKLKLPPRIVIASSHLPYDVWPAIVLSRRYKSKMVVYVFHLIQKQNRSRGLKNLVSTLSEHLSLPIIRRFADLVITDNQVVYSQLKTMGFVQDRMKISHVGIPLRKIHNASSRSHDYQVVVLGRLVRNKGIFDLPEIWARISSVLPDRKLLIVGDGPERLNLSECFKVTGSENNVKFTGFVDEVTKYGLLKGSKVFLAPSHEEGWGIAVCEGMACGLPVVGYDLPAYGSVFRQGMLKVPTGDKALLAQNVIKLLQNEELRHAIGKAAYQQALEYDVTAIAEQQWAWLRQTNSQ